MIGGLDKGMLACWRFRHTRARRGPADAGLRPASRVLSKTTPRACGTSSRRAAPSSTRTARRRWRRRCGGGSSPTVQRHHRRDVPSAAGRARARDRARDLRERACRRGRGRLVRDELARSAAGRSPCWSTRSKARGCSRECRSTCSSRSACPASDAGCATSRPRCDVAEAVTTTPVRVSPASRGSRASSWRATTATTPCATSSARFAAVASALDEAGHFASIDEVVLTAGGTCLLRARRGERSTA